MKRGLIISGLFFGLVLQAQVVGWRVDGNGKYPDGPEIKEISAEKGVLWKYPTKEWSNATPIVVNDKVIFCEEISEIVCVSAKDGKELWRKSNSYMELLTPEQRAEAEEKEKQVAELQKKKNPINKKYRELRNKSKKEPANKELKKKIRQLQGELRKIDNEIKNLSKLLRPKTHKVNGYSSPTPVSDGKNIFVLFGTGVLVGYDLDGKRKWIKQVPIPKHGWGTCASPFLSGGKFIIHIADQVLAFNPADGKKLWKVDSKSAWGSLTECKIGEEDAIITGKADLILTQNGKVIAKNMVPIPWQTPIVEKGIMYVADGSGAFAVKLPATVDGKPEKLWEQKYDKPRKDRYYASPVLYEGLLYSITQNGHLSVLNASTGELVYEKKTGLGRTIYPSPALIGKYLFLSNDKGKIIVIKPGKTYSLISESTLEPFRSCPVVYNGKLYIRGLKNLYCMTAWGINPINIP